MLHPLFALIVLCVCVCDVFGEIVVHPQCTGALDTHARGQWKMALSIATNEIARAKTSEQLQALIDCFFSAALSLNAMAFSGAADAELSHRTFRLVRRIQREDSRGGWNVARERTVRCFADPRRRPNLPYLSCGTFRAMADWLHDGQWCGFDPQLVRDGDVVFVNSFLLREFFSTEHPYIRARYTLITHCSDESAPGVHEHMLEDPKLLTWFAQNTDISEHPKLRAIPIGLGDALHAHGDVAALERAMEAIPSIPREGLLYININVRTWADRVRALEAMARQGFDIGVVDPQKPLPYEEYLQDLAAHRFVLCPAGNGLDTHRTWEALLMGAIPVVETSSLDPLYADLPVLIVEDWEQVTQDLLEDTWETLATSSFNRSKLYAAHWKRLIRAEHT